MSETMTGTTGTRCAEHILSPGSDCPSKMLEHIHQGLSVCEDQCTYLVIYQVQSSAREHIPLLNILKRPHRMLPHHLL
jgi:hypothetical protein